MKPASYFEKHVSNFFVENKDVNTASRKKSTPILLSRDHISILARFRLPLFGVHSMHSVAFVRRINPDGSQTSSCPKCQNVITTAAAEIVLEAAEDLHICDLSALSDSLLSGYRTLTERVLMFLEGHSS
jgi:hypothetical protein